MYSFRVKQYQDADYVYYVICVQMLPDFPNVYGSYAQLKIINDLLKGMYNVYIRLMRHHYDQMMLFMIYSHPVFA